MATPDPVDPATLEIKTRSIEQTLHPLVKQISTLVSHRERPLCSDRSLRAVARVGQAVNLAVERFVTVGETIADGNPEIREDMYQACKRARDAGSAIEKLCECATEDSLADRGSVVRAARCLLGSVTKVLLLADIVVVKQLLLAKKKVARSLGRLESVSNFTEFVKAFSQFGAEMVELAHLTGDRQNDLKDERRRAQMAAARQVLERSTMMLLTSSKTCLRHPECPSARENRDTVFCQMRRAMDLIHYVVKDGVLDCSESQSYSNSQSPQQEDWDSSTAFSALKHFERLVETTRMTLLGPGCRETLTAALDTVIERTQDFTDSAYTTHEHRENILLLCDRAQLELNTLLRIGNSMNYEGGGGSPSSEMEQAVLGVLRTTRDLRQQLCTTTMEQAADLGQVTKAGQELVSTIRNVALANDRYLLQESNEKFREYIEHILEVCKMLRHVALSESLQVSAKFTEINLRIYGPQVVTAAYTLARHPTSKIAKENLEVFADMWQWLMTDVTTVAKDVLELNQNRPEKQVYMSLPRPGKHGTTSKPLKPVKLDSEEQAKIAKAGLEMKLITSEMDAETEKWQESGSALEENNDIVKRAKNMSSMAFSMYQFTRGEGALKTTQDLFTQAEYFAEEANRLYKVVRQFSYQVPGGPHKKELLENLDRVPTYVQQLQFTVKNPTVGKAATFTKVDNVIQETKNLMNVISKVVTTCFVCATKHNVTMPQYMELSPTIPGLAEEDCLYPVSPQLLPSTSPYVQPYPLTSAQLHNILRGANLGFPLFNYNTLPNTTSTSTATRNSASFVHPSVLPYSTPITTSTCGPQAPYCLQNLQLLQLQLQQAQLQHLRHAATLPR
ncbi:alpha-catenin related isoform X3 [Bombus vancouverensis nearcticus]|uniref:Alpha-catulin isoform X1 n=1 Tax=Bombus bifarius TaxID=103933 RepID=A0A6P8MBW0_9HYME|nr:alpha-catulin isoform X1 [Bombus vancouverensis nearcticus]XP_033204366.1 alpha-catulin isoform X1 [Bombus vancouverensis nearcticus]XP_033305622.1 alpha-catulin isoform X1 [Bombus bifarius]XP_033305623.1 alpha-catulin isoform X1 [Bombus bifarius]